MREMMSQRYDKKRWYVQPTDAMYVEARQQNTTASSSRSQPTKPLTLVVGNNVSPLNVRHDEVCLSMFCHVLSACLLPGFCLSYVFLHRTKTRMAFFSQRIIGMHLEYITF